MQNLKLKKAGDALEKIQAQYGVLYEHAPIGYLTLDRVGTIVALNPAAAALLEQVPAALVGQDLLKFLAHESRPAFTALRASAFEGEVGDITELEILNKEQKSLFVQIKLAMEPSRETCVAMLLDITERKRLENRLFHQTLHDDLTGLPHRLILVDRITQAIATAQRDHRRVMVSCLDLDHFKRVNNNYGHEVGDELLKVVSARVSDCLGDGDVLARIGGDEFALVLGGMADNAADVEAIERIRDAVSQPIVIKGHHITVTSSAGCSAYPNDGQTAEALLRFADTAMSDAKRSGRNKLQVYEVKMSQRLEERMRLEEELHHALDRKQLRLEYQPEVDLRTGEIKGVEALLRWWHPTLGTIEPARFIPLAEETGLIEKIGAWVIDCVCAQAAEWQARAEMPHVPIAINLSAKQLGKDGLELQLARCLETMSLNPACLELELTESASMDSPEHVFPQMHRLKHMGLSIAIDDFGTGFSNMRYLQRLPVDKLKLDGSFVKEIATDPGSLAIAETTISIAHRLGIKVVAEMVENEEQVRLLREYGCDLAQGCYFSLALPPDECAELLIKGTLPLPTYS